MTVQIKHPFVSAKPDGLDSTLIQPSNWNDTHSIQVSGASLLGKATSGSGAVVEIALGTNLSFSGNTLNATGGSGGGGVSLAVADKGSTVTSGASSINFTGAVVTTTSIGTSVTVDVQAATPAQGDRADTAVQPGGLTKSAVGLSNVDNTSDTNKPISSAAATALSGKANATHAHSFSDVTGLATAFSGKSDVGHSHVAANITDFDTAIQAVAMVPQVSLANVATSVVGTELVGIVNNGNLLSATINQLLTLVNSMVAIRDNTGAFIGMSMPGGGPANDMIVIGSTEPINDDGRPNGTIYIKVG